MKVKISILYSYSNYSLIIQSLQLYLFYLQLFSFALTKFIKPNLRVFSFFIAIYKNIKTMLLKCGYVLNFQLNVFISKQNLLV